VHVCVEEISAGEKRVSVMGTKRLQLHNVLQEFRQAKFDMKIF